MKKKHLGLLLSFGSIIISILAYSFYRGTWFAIGFVLLLFIHEMGHVIALKIKKLPVSAPVFIPFLGAAIFTSDFGDPETEAYVGYGGPLLGGLSALATFFVWLFTPQPSQMLLLLSIIATGINLFNLIPISPMDGGRITQVIGPWFKSLGLAGLLIGALSTKQPVFMLLWLIILAELDIGASKKLILGVISEAVMLIMMSSGTSRQSVGVNTAYIVLATLINFGFFIRVKAGVSTKKSPQKKIVAVKTRVRVKWLILYLVLVLGLSLLLMLQVNQLPHKLN